MSKEELAMHLCLLGISGALLRAVVKVEAPGEFEARA